MLLGKMVARKVRSATGRKAGFKILVRIVLERNLQMLVVSVRNTMETYEGNWCGNRTNVCIGLDGQPRPRDR